MIPERMTTEDAAREILKSCNLGTLSLVTPDGHPYGVPINYYYNESENLIYLHCAQKGKKIDCINDHPEVSFSVYKNPVIVQERLTTLYDSVIVTGYAEIITDLAQKRAMMTAFCNAICPAGVQRLEKTDDGCWHAVAIIKIIIEKIEGKRSRDA